MTTHKIEYDDTLLATVEIDPVRAAEPIKEMVDFWVGSESNLAKQNGDYTKTWLVMLAKFIVRNEKPPENEEGWYPLDGTHGIKIAGWDWDGPEFDESLVGIETD